MTNKRYNIKPSNIVEDGFCIQDDEKEHSFPTVDDKSHLIMYEKALNEQNNRIKELQQTIDTIAKDYEESHGMDIRNAEWFTAW